MPFMNFSCLPSWTSANPVDVGYIWYVCIAGGVIPAVVILMSNFVIHDELRKVNKWHYLLKIKTQCIIIIIISKYDFEQNVYIFQHDKLSNNTAIKLWKQCRKRENLLMILAFSICWLPFGCVYTIPLFGIEEKETTNSTTSNKVFPLLTVKFGCAIINPLVYGYENSKVNMIAFIFGMLGNNYVPNKSRNDQNKVLYL